MKKQFKELIGYEGSIIELSNKLVTLGCEDICDFNNWREILTDKNVIVSTDINGEIHIQIYFDLLFNSGIDEVIEATDIKIISVEEF